MRQKLFFLFLIASIFISSQTRAQGNYEDLLYLKNGSVLHGIIIEQVPNVSIKIQTKDRNVFVYRMDEVLKIAKEEVIVTRRKREPLTKDNIKRRGYMNITEISIGRGLNENDINMALTGNKNGDQLPSIGVQTVNGYMFNPYLSAGIGIGLHLYNDPAFVPIFADLRVDLLDGPVTPFVAVDAGYSFTAKEIYGIDNSKKYFGGTYFNPVFGVKFYTRKSKALEFSIGYRQQEARFYVTEYGAYPNYYVKSTWQNFTLEYLNTRVGFVF